MDDIRINNILPKRSKLRFNNAEVKFLYFNNKKVWPKTEAVGIPLIDTSGRTIGNQVEFNKINNAFYDKYNGHIDLNVEGTIEIITNNNNCLNVTGNNIKYNNYGVGSVSVNPTDTEKYKSSTINIRCNELIFEHYKGAQTNNVDASGTRNIQITIKSRYNGNLLNITKDNIKTDCNWITINNDITVDRSTNTITFSYNVAQYANTVDLRSGNITIKPTMPNDMHDIKNSYVPELSYRITQSAVETKTLYIKYADNTNINNYVDLYCINNDTKHLKNDDSRHQSMCELALFDSNGNSVDAIFKSSNPNHVKVTNSNVCTLGVGETGSYGSSEITATPAHSERDVIYDIKPVVVHMNYVTFDADKTSATFDWDNTHSQSSKITVTKNGYSDIDKVSVDSNYIYDAEITGNNVLYSFKDINKSKSPVNISLDILYNVGNDITLTKEINLIQSACPYNLIEQNGVDFKITGPETLQYGETGTYVLSMTNFNKSDIKGTSWVPNNSDVKITGNDGDIRVTLTNNLPGEDVSKKIILTCIVTDKVDNQKRVHLNITCHSQKPKYIEFTDTTPISTVIVNGKQHNAPIRVNYKTTDNNQVLNNVNLHVGSANVLIKNRTNSYIEFELQNVNDSFYGDKQISISCDGYKQGSNSTRTLHVDNYSLRFNDSESPYTQYKTFNATGESTKYEDNPKLKYTYTVNGDNTKAIVINSDSDRFSVSYDNSIVSNVSFSKLYFDANLNDNTSTNSRYGYVQVKHNTYPELSLKLDYGQLAKAITYAKSVSIRNASNGNVLSNGNTIYMQTNSQIQNLEAYVQPTDYNSTYEWNASINNLNGNTDRNTYTNKSIKFDISSPRSHKYVLSVKESNTTKIHTAAAIEVCSAITGISISTPINSTVGKETRVPITVSSASSNNPLTWSISNNDKINATIDKNNKQLVINSNTEFNGNITINCTDKLGNKVSTVVHIENKPSIVYATSLSEISIDNTSTIQTVKSTDFSGDYPLYFAQIDSSDKTLKLMATAQPQNYNGGYTWLSNSKIIQSNNENTFIVPLENTECDKLYTCSVKKDNINHIGKLLRIYWMHKSNNISVQKNINIGTNTSYHIDAIVQYVDLNGKTVTSKYNYIDNWKIRQIHNGGRGISPDINVTIDKTYNNKATIEFTTKSSTEIYQPILYQFELTAEDTFNYTLSTILNVVVSSSNTNNYITVCNSTDREIFVMLSDKFITSGTLEVNSTYTNITHGMETQMELPLVYETKEYKLYYRDGDNKPFIYGINVQPNHTYTLSNFGSRFVDTGISNN